MPGSILVSVLDFKELPSSSNSVKLSLGKVEHEAGEKGTFSFPFMNLRDNLIITIQDSQGNQVSQSGIRTMSIIEKGTWDDVFPIEGGGLIQMKLQFFLSDEERNRIRFMRESAMKKKQIEILGSRHGVSGTNCFGSMPGLFDPLANPPDSSLLLSLSQMKELNEFDSIHSHLIVNSVLHWNFSERFCLDVLSASSSQYFQKSGVNTDISLKASESCDGIKEESFQGQSFTSVTDKREEMSFPHAKQEIEQKTNSFNSLVEKLNSENLKENISNDVKEASEILSSNKNNPILLQQAEVPEKLLKGTETGDILKYNNLVKSEPLSNQVERLDKQNIEDKGLTGVKKMSKESKFPPFSKETEVNAIENSEIQSQETDVLKRLQDSSARGVGSSRLTVSEKIKSFSTKLAGEMDEQGLLEKTPQSIKKMISVFESSISQDKVPLKPVSTKSYRSGISRLVKDYNEKSESSLYNSERSGSSRLRNSFSMSDLRENLSDITTKGDQVIFDNNYVETSENMQSKGYDPKGAKKMGKEFINNRENLSKSPNEGVKVEKESADVRKTSKGNVDYFDQDSSSQWKFLDGKRQSCLTAEGDRAISLLNDCKIEEQGHQEKIVASTPQIVVKGEEIENLESADVEASNGSFGQAIKIALVVGFGVVVLLFRQREFGKGKKKENTHALRNQVFLNRRGSIKEQGRRIGVSRLS